MTPKWEIFLQAVSCYWLFHQWNMLEQNYYYIKNLEIFLTHQHFHPQVSQKFRPPTLCQADHSHQMEGNVLFHWILSACHVPSAAGSPAVWVRYHWRQQEKEGNSTPCDNSLWLSQVKQKEVELSRFGSFILFMGTQLLLLESHKWSQKRFVC